MNIAELFISLGVKGDTKALDATIEKLKEAKKQATGLVTELKNLDKAGGSTAVGSFAVGKVSSARTNRNSTRAEWERDIKREESVNKKRIQLEEKREKDKIKEEKEQEKEQKKREKDRERATKKFFGQIESGFSTVAKTFLGGLAGTALGGYITAQASKSVGAANLSAQYGIDPETANRYANAFKVGSGGAISKQGGISLIGNLAQNLANNALTNELLPQFTALGLSPDAVRDPVSLFKALRQTSLDNPYKEKYFTALTGGLGIPPEVAQVLNSKQTSEKEFNRLYNLPNLSNEEIQAGRRISSKTAELETAIDKLAGTLLEKFEPAINKIIDFIQQKLTPENVSSAVKVAGVGAAAYIATKAVKFAKFNPVAAVATAGYGYYQFLSHLAEKNEKILYGKRKNKGEYIADFGANNYSPTDYNRSYSPAEIEAAKQFTSISPQSNITNNITTNIKTDSIDQNSIPALSDSITGKIKELQFNSDFLRRTIPK